ESAGAGRATGLPCHLRAQRASSDQGPGPAHRRKATVSNWAYSERTSCKTAQKPVSGGDGGRGSGEVPRYRPILVESMATTISMRNGRGTKRVPRPRRISRPPTISSPPTKEAVASGKGKPSLVNRPTPWLA